MNSRKEPKSQIPTFAFRPELFEQRAIAIEKLAQDGIVWMTDYGSADICHGECGIEICGLRSEANARRVLQILKRLFPEWRYQDCWYKESGRDPGWWVTLQKYPSTF